MTSVPHLHNWTLAGHPDGHVQASCPCGQQRLLAGTTVHGRLDADRAWVTPSLWNPRRETA